MAAEDRKTLSGRATTSPAVQKGFKLFQLPAVEHSCSRQLGHVDVAFCSAIHHALQAERPHVFWPILAHSFQVEMSWTFHLDVFRWTRQRQFFP